MNESVWGHAMQSVCVQRVQVHLPGIHCLYTIYMLGIHCLYTVYMLGIHCLYIEYILERPSFLTRILHLSSGRPNGSISCFIPEGN